MHPGTQHALRLAEELEQHGLLYRFWTGWAKAGPHPGKRAVNIHGEKLRTRPWVEAAAWLLQKLGLSSETACYWRNTIFQKLLPELEIRAADVVVGFDTASHILARRAKRAGKKMILEQSILDPQAKEDVLQKMARRYPEWIGEAGKRSARLLSAEREEQRLADKISVPSDYVGTSLVLHGVPEGKVFVNPFGTNLLKKPEAIKKVSEGRQVKFLFAGTVAGRKGVPLLMEAWKRIGSDQARLTIAGDLANWPPTAKRPETIRFTGLLSKQSLAQIFMEHDVFVFPSYAEGMPLVVLEAMSFGLPVIGTPVVEGSVQNDVHGQIVPFDDPLKLAEAMQGMVANPAKIRQMGEAARKRAEEFTWKAYGDRYSRLIQELLKT